MALTDVTLFIGSIIVVVLGVLGYAVYRVGGFREAKEYIQRREGKGVLASMGLAIGVIAVALLLLTSAAEAQWTELYAGSDYTFKTSPQCKKEDPIDEHITSHIGVRQHLYSHNRFSLIANYTHHSCFIGVDRESYDGVGIQAVYRIKW